jgi:hypothetical protein
MTQLDRGINAATGEIGLFVPDGENYVIRTQEQIDDSRRHFERQSRVDFGRHVDFTFAAMEAIHEVSSALTTTQCGYLLLLQCYIDYDNNALKTTKSRYMDTADMIDVLQLKRKRSTFYKFMTACLDNAIITKTDDGVYVVDPRYHFRGTTHNQQVIRSYTAKIKHVYREMNAADLGLIYRMLPFVNYEMNALCSNPTERSPEKVRWLSRRELADAIGVSEGEISRRLPKITIGDEYIIARIHVGGQTMYMFNPLVFKRNNKPVDETSQTIFSVRKPAK